MTRSTSFPTVTAASVNIGPNDVRSILQERTSPPPTSPLLDCPLLFRDTAIDLEAALDFEEPDPAPVSTVRSSFDFAQSVKGRSRAPAPASPIPSALLLHSIRPMLRPNENAITFTVSSLIQGPKTAAASLFLWTPDVRLVVSDIDGTVTKSDVLGHILPPLGRDWTHPGLVSLYKSIASLGIKFVYLSSRPIGEAAITRTMIRKIEQRGDQMPIGPIIMTPDAMFAAIQREVKRKPQEFKIPELLAISQLFEPEPMPWVLGFGNRKTDVISYKASGMTGDQIFLFNPKHEVLDSEGRLLFKGISAMTPEIDKIIEKFLRPREVVASDDDL
jgi:phosphatidate phosphatase LPIN